MAELSENELQLLRGTFFFGVLSEVAIRAAVADGGCWTAQAEKGRVIYDPHDFSRSLAVILSGRVQVSKEGYVVSILEQGEVFGAAALFNDREDYATTLTARTGCRMAFFSQELMEGLLARHADMAAAYIRYLSGRIRFLEGKLDDLLAPSAERKLSQYLLSHREGSSVTLNCPMSGLAHRLDLGRTSLYRAFDALTNAGAIEKNGKTVRILKEEILL